MRRPARFVQATLFDTIDRRPGPVHRDAAIAQTIRRCKLSKDETFLVKTSQAKLVNRASLRKHQFTVDDVGLILDEAGLGREMILRRRIVSAILNGGRGKLWKVSTMMVMSHDPIRHARRVPVWFLIR